MNLRPPKISPYFARNSMLAMHHSRCPSSQLTPAAAGRKLVVMQPATEKRRARRVKVSSIARVKMPAAAGEVVEVQARTRDVSQNGVFLYLDQQLEPGAAIEMVLMLPDEISEQGRGW